MTGIKLIEVKEDVLADNDNLATSLRNEHRGKGIFLMNLMASPGAGKTSLLLQTIRGLKLSLRMGVIEADIESTVDAEKVARENIPTVQLRTGGLCHLDASMVKNGLQSLDLNNLDFIVIENVGNLVCPAEFDTGAFLNAMILSVPEGDDKPLKYPLMFTVSNVLIVNKIDYLFGSDFNMDALRERVWKLNPDMKIFPVSCKTGEGISSWIDWLRSQITLFKKSV